MHPKDISIKDFWYDLPNDKIAAYPLEERHSSKLLIYKNETITESTYKNIADYLEPNTTLFFNNTKVIQARLLFKNKTEANIEIFCLEPSNEYPDIAKAMSRQGQVKWLCMVGKAAKWKDKTLSLHINDCSITAEIIEKTNDTYLIHFTWQPEHLSFAEILDTVGAMPIPPYLKRQSQAIDTTRYQTVYAEEKGSVAAPTAGLHFTNHIFSELTKKNISCNFLTLHVGAGTFKPVKAATMENHFMHEEWIDVSIDTLEKIKESNPTKIIAVGTTSLRTLETIYWMGVKAHINPTATLAELEIKQWDVYEINAQDTLLDIAIDSLIKWMQTNNTVRLICKTQILIAPPYQLKTAYGIVTNFHQPESTLLLLVAAVAGKNWKKIYEHALRNNYRFLSYGDGSLLFKPSN
ncbi:MAG: S-adenosylmethionine:tRNA ribosyltransferase-isomerase [Bacteroidetes bacterium]|nr:S-adenosylmethionine:tRNA ribosyltransferase-isomerase [Bacteroidota bacterium]